MPADLYLVRHGDTALNARGVFRSHLNPPLNADGLDDADRLAYYFSDIPVVRLTSSPMRRAMQTARVIGQETGVAVHQDPNWQPWHLGEWAGQASAPLVPKMLQAIQTDQPPPGGEPFSDFRARVTDGLRRAQAQAQHADGNVVVVTHVRNVRLVLDLLRQPKAGPDELENVARTDDPVEPGGVVRLAQRPDGQWTATAVRLPAEEHAMAKGFQGR